MISARFCVFKKQGTPNDGANVENISTIRQKKYIDAFLFRKAGFYIYRLGSARFAIKKSRKGLLFSVSIGFRPLGDLQGTYKSPSHQVIIKCLLQINAKTVICAISVICGMNFNGNI